MDTQADFPVSVALCGGRRQEVRIGRSTTWDQFRRKVREQARLYAGRRSLAKLLRGRAPLYVCECVARIEDLVLLLWSACYSGKRKDMRLLCASRWNIAWICLVYSGIVPCSFFHL